MNPNTFSFSGECEFVSRNNCLVNTAYMTDVFGSASTATAISNFPKTINKINPELTFVIIARLKLTE